MEDVKTSCVYCKHNQVCAVYDVFMDADIKANDFNVLCPGCDDKVYQTLAQNCTQWTSQLIY